MNTKVTSEKDENNQLLILSLWDFHYIIKITNNGLFIDYSLSTLNAYFSFLSYYFLQILFHIFPTIYFIKILSSISQTTTNNRTLIEFIFAINKLRQIHELIDQKHVNLTLSEITQLFFYQQNEKIIKNFELTAEQQVLYQYIYKSPEQPKINDKEYVQQKVCELIKADKQQRLVIKMLCGLASELEKQVVQTKFMELIIKEYDFKTEENFIKKKICLKEYILNLLTILTIIIVFKFSKMLLVLLLAIYTIAIYLQNRTPVEIIRIILVLWTLVTLMIKSLLH
jgi:hypothetical protein